MPVATDGVVDVEADDEIPDRLAAVALHTLAGAEGVAEPCFVAARRQPLARLAGGVGAKSG